MTQTTDTAPRRWLVTGASRGLGHAVAALALAKGDHVCLVARGPDIADKAAKLGPGAMGVQADISQPGALCAVADAMVERWGGVDVLVNNAAVHRGGKVDALSVDDWNLSLATNLSGPMHAVRAILPHMPEGGSIVNIGAVVGFRGFPGDSCYGASKMGLAGLTQVLAAELAARHIRVNLVVPGFVLTEMTSGLSDRARDKIVSKVPLKRMGAAEEIANVIWWVAGSTYMTGSVVTTDGGLSCSL